MNSVYDFDDRTIILKRRAPLPSYSFHQMCNLPAPEYLIAELMVAGGLYSVVAPPGVGKSWLEQKIALAVATGLPFQGRATKRGTVVRLVSERFVLEGQRLRGWRACHPLEAAAISTDDMHHYPDPIALHDLHSVERLISDLEEKGIKPTLLSIDTLVLNILGVDENSAAALGPVIAGLRLLQERLGCTILIVHHTGKDGRSERGSNSLRGVLDGLWMLRKENKSGRLELRCEKENWGPGFESMLFTLDTAGGHVTLEDVVAVEMPNEESDAPTTAHMTASESCGGKRPNAKASANMKARHRLALSIVNGAGGRTTRRAVSAALQAPGTHQVGYDTAYKNIREMIRAGILGEDGPDVFVPPEAARAASEG